MTNDLLVPKLSLGTHLIEALLRELNTGFVSDSGRTTVEAELRDARSQAELGNEGSGAWERGNVEIETDCPASKSIGQVDPAQ